MFAELLRPVSNISRRGVNAGIGTLSSHNASAEERWSSREGNTLCQSNRSTTFASTPVLSFSPFAAVSLLGVAGLAETSPSFSVSGPFLLDFPRFQVPSDCIVPSQLRSSPRALPLHLHFHNCSDVFSFMSSFDVPEPFQPSPSHNCCYRFHLCLFQDLLISPAF